MGKLIFSIMGALFLNRVASVFVWLTVVGFSSGLSPERVQAATRSPNATLLIVSGTMSGAILGGIMGRCYD